MDKTYEKGNFLFRNYCIIMVFFVATKWVVNMYFVWNKKQRENEFLESFGNLICFGNCIYLFLILVKNILFNTYLAISSYIYVEN